MELLSQADRAVARHMLTIVVIIGAVAGIWYVGSEFLATADDLSTLISEQAR